jgi:hypothetical protein
MLAYFTIPLGESNKLMRACFNEDPIVHTDFSNREYLNDDLGIDVIGDCSKFLDTVTWEHYRSIV